MTDDVDLTNSGIDPALLPAQSEFTKSKTEAPTSGITKTAAESSEAAKATLTEVEYDFVNLMHQHYFINGSLPTEELAKERYGIIGDNYVRLTNSVAVRSALFERGVTFAEPLPEDETWRGQALTGEQLIVADTMLDLIDQRSYKKKLQDLGVSSKKWQTWLKDPVFAKYLDDNTQSVLKHGQHEAALALMDKVQGGDLKAIQLYLEYTGRWVSQQGTNSNTAPVGQEDEVRRLLREFVQIIVEEVDDHQLASKIADRIKTIGAREQIMNTLEGNGPKEIEQPQVVKNRVLTDTMSNSGMAI